MNNQMKGYTWLSLGGSRAQELLSLWSRGAAPSQCGSVHPLGSSTNFALLGFYGGFLT